jgi:chromosomal replication initiator protein
MDGIWQEFLKIAREEAGSRVVETWFKAVSLTQWDAHQKIVHLQAPNEFVKSWLQNNYLPLFQMHLGRLLQVNDPKIILTSERDERMAGRDERAVRVVHAEDKPRDLPIAIQPAKHAFASMVPKQTDHINRNFVFDTFVVGPSNSLAYAAAHAVSEKPGLLYNPLFVYGKSGLGKTHLLHAIGNAIRMKSKNASILYQPADRFVTEFINAIRFDKIHKFKAKYQSIDVLLIDDIQFISNKEQTQEAFFHIFNSLYEAGKQIVFSSDTYPTDIDGIADRLRSRLSCGLVTDIHVPSLETKIAILKKKACASGEELPDDVAHFIGSCVISNIRELEGGLIRVLAFATLTKQSVNLELAKRVLLRSMPAQKQRVIDFDHIIASIYKHYPYDPKELRAKGRNKELAFVRQIAMFLMKKHTDKSLRDIGTFLGGRDHSTVMHAIAKVEGLMVENSEFQKKIAEIEATIFS